MTQFLTAEGPQLRTASLQRHALLLFHLFNTNELVILQTPAFRNIFLKYNCLNIHTRLFAPGQNYGMADI